MDQRSSSRQPDNLPQGYSLSQDTTRIYSLGPWDILCGRCRSAYHNIGNRRFRITISLNFRRYINATSSREKSAIVRSIVRLLKHEVGARFVRPCEGGFYVEISESEARAKVGHALRDLVATPRPPEGGKTTSSLDET
jgi:hypothetical protein